VIRVLDASIAVNATYAALAMELGGTWLTLDAAAHRRIEALGISTLAV
jgi:hypothetical protein